MKTPEYGRITLLAAIAFCAMAAASGAETKTPAIKVFAASSLTDFVIAAGKAFEAEHPEFKIATNFASSATLARQLENAPIDAVFLSAHPKWTKYLVDKGLAREDRVLFGNELVVAAMGSGRGRIETLGRTTRPDSILGGRIAIGDPESVPAGEYAKQALIALDWYGYALPRLLPCASVRAALQALISGESDTAIVFSTDLAGRSGVSAIARFAEGSHEPVLYSAAIVSEAKRPPAGLREFLEFLSGESGREIAGGLGFRIEGAAP